MTSIRWLAAAGVLALATVLPVRELAAAPSDDDCLACHDDAALTRDDGRALAFDKKALSGSVHGQAGLSCVDCHADLAAVSDFPHEPKLAKAACAACHDQPAAEHAKGVHAAKPAGGAPVAACSDCHGSHDILPAKDPASRTNHFNVPATCLSCHSDPKRYPRLAEAKPGHMPLHFGDSLHGKALSEAGLSVAPNCSSCHQAHDVRKASDPESPVSRSKVPGTCGKCHEKILGHYTEGVHGAAVARGNPKAPVCADCHSAHEVSRTAAAAWQVDVIKECGTCHEASLETYRDTYHGQVTALGFARVATCAACHDSHRIFPKEDARSTISPARRLQTCQKCHANATAGFAEYDPHADPHDKVRNPVLSFTSQFMKLLLGFVFAFFGVHTLLWLPRSFAERRRLAALHGAGAKGERPRESDEKKEEGR